LVLACSACGKESPEGFQFCPHCGAALVDVHASPAAEERKIVSVLFCDVVGFTAASEQADPEDMRARMQPYYSRLRREIDAFGGRVEKFIGDAVMAVFGAPVAHEDDAERAVRAGLRILEAIGELNERDPALELSVRVGINTGEVVVSLGATNEGEAAVMGDAVNTAARIQTSAPVNGVAVGEGTFRATERVFEYAPLEAVAVKGKADPVPLWQALAARARFGSDVIRSMTTPLVGRETDLLLLRGTFDKSVRERSVQLVTLVGEPGVGKSRLVAELFAYIDALPELIVWRQGRCLPYGDGITFWALSEIVKAHAGIYESDAPEEATRKLELLLPEEEEKPWLRARLLPLLGIDSGATASREESFTAWRRFLERIAEQGPCVLVVEDLHWADEALLAFVEHLADWAQGVSLLIVCTARPELYEQHAAWASGLPNATAIHLSPLSNDETARLISGLLERAVLPAETQQLLLERAGGNPLYAEEFVRMLHDRELLEPRGTLRTGSEVPFPDSLQALIAARLDTLTAERKSLLQDAAVIGKIFWTGALQAMGERSRSEIEFALHELARKELVRPARQSSMQGEQELAFWHILVRDVAYAQIPRAQRALKHLQAATWLEAKAGERLEDLAEVLAYHTVEALQLAETTRDESVKTKALPRARRYAFLAGERALGLDAAKAVELLGKALTLTPGDDREHPVVLARWGEAMLDSGARDKEAVNVLEEAVEAFRRTGDVEAAAQTLLTLAEGLQRRLDPAVVTAVEEAVALSETKPQSPVLVDALAKLAGVHWRKAELGAALAAAKRALDLAAQLGLGVHGLALGYRGLARCDDGDIGGLADAEKSVEMLIAEGHGRDAAVLHNNLGYIHWCFEGPAAAVRAFGRAEEFAIRRGLVGVARIAATSRLSVLVEAGRLDEALALADGLLPLLDESGNAWAAGEARAMQARALAERGVGAGEIAEAALVEMRAADTNDQFIIATTSVAIHRIADGRTESTRALLRELIEIRNIRESGEYGPRLPALVRCALAADDLELAARLVEGVEPTLPIREHALVMSEALLAEARAEYAAAASGFADAVARWDGSGARLEQAYALLGQGRCLAAIGDSAAAGVLRRACALFDEMGARPRVDECNRLIGNVSALSS
jgi:class 3 adenylate cyclase/tetratricopeptide (TPR) repeat protein